jgi:hypothetical protein
MSIQWVDTPRTLTHFDPPPGPEFDNDLGLDEGHVRHIAELFETPLTGAYNWDYQTQDDRIRKLYELGKELNWNASVDIDWKQTPDFQDRPPVTDEQRAMVQANRDGALFKGFAPWEAMDADQVLQWMRHRSTQSSMRRRRRSMKRGTSRCSTATCSARSASRIRSRAA